MTRLERFGIAVLVVFVTGLALLWITACVALILEFIREYA